MVLTPHAIIGAAVARAFPTNPLLAFTAALVSHFLLDAIPHWHYSLRSQTKDPLSQLNDDMKIGSPFFFDLIRTGADFWLGFILTFLLFPASDSSLLTTNLAGIIGGVLPDPLQFVYWKIRKEPLRSLQRFHLGVHSKIYISNPFIGVSSQAAVVILAVLISKLAIP